MIRPLISAIALVGLVQLASPGTAEAGKYKNLKVLKDNGKAVQKGMKHLTKGLGVKCNACHVKGKFAEDSVAAKGATRTFFSATVGNKDAKARGEALKALLKALKLEKAKKEEKVWKGVDLLEKK